MREIRLSYRLIFSDMAASRAHFNRTEKKRLIEDGPHDPLLATICGESPRKTNERNSYSKAVDFPILAARLSKIQRYITSQNPKTLSMIWKDKRNPVQWYTFWAVVWIGGFGIVLGLVQTGLAAAQVYYAIHQR
jgi:hypothetical protein